jgi:hypothetical protein
MNAVSKIKYATVQKDIYDLNIMRSTFILGACSPQNSTAILLVILQDPLVISRLYVPQPFCTVHRVQCNEGRFSGRLSNTRRELHGSYWIIHFRACVQVLEIFANSLHPKICFLKTGRGSLISLKPENQLGSEND